jgi:hypothetical protein
MPSVVSIRANGGPCARSASAARVGDQADRRARVVHDRDRHEHRREALDRELVARPHRAVRVRALGLDVLAAQPPDVLVRRELLEVLGEGELLELVRSRLERGDRRDEVDVLAALEDERVRAT